MTSWNDDLQKMLATFLQEADKTGTLKVTGEKVVKITKVVNGFGGIRFHEIEHFVKTLKAGLKAMIFVVNGLPIKLSQKCSKELQKYVCIETSTAHIDWPYATMDINENALKNSLQSDAGLQLSLEDILLIMTQVEIGKLSKENLISVLSDNNKEGMKFQMNDLMFSPKLGKNNNIKSIIRVETAVSVDCLKYFPPLFDFDSNICLKFTEFSAPGNTIDICM